MTSHEKLYNLFNFYLSRNQQNIPLLEDIVNNRTTYTLCSIIIYVYYIIGSMNPLIIEVGFIFDWSLTTGIII